MLQKPGYTVSYSPMGLFSRTDFALPDNLSQKYFLYTVILPPIPLTLDFSSPFSFVLEVWSEIPLYTVTYCNLHVISATCWLASWVALTCSSAFPKQFFFLSCRFAGWWGHDRTSRFQMDHGNWIKKMIRWVVPVRDIHSWLIQRWGLYLIIKDVIKHSF